MTRERPLILAVDDEPANLALLRKLLTRQGYDVVEASTAPSALAGDRGARARPRLPRRDDAGHRRHRGLPAAARASPSTPACRSCCSPRSTAAEDKARGLEAGANDFLSKPFDESELSARLRSLLRTKALQDRLADLLGRYVSESVAAEVLRDPFAVSLGGDRRHVSTLFADIRGYTALAAEHPPEDDARPAQPVPDRRQRRRRARTAAPSPTSWATASSRSSARRSMHSDDPERAVRAALAVQTAVMRLEIPTMPGVRLQAGIGITSGEVIAGNIGSERRMHYAVVGDSVNVAARLQAAAGPGQILVDEATHDAVRDLVVVAGPRQPAARRQGRLGPRLPDPQRRARPRASMTGRCVRRGRPLSLREDPDHIAEAYR